MTGIILGILFMVMVGVLAASDRDDNNHLHFG